MSSPVLLVERTDAVATVTLNRPQAMNALSRELRQALTLGFRELAADPAARVVILTGAGRAFCAGLDLKELGSRDGQAAGDPSVGALGDADMLAAVRDFPGPVIGAVGGFAITGGFELALACDLLVASTQARFADTHARVGILPGWGLSQKLPRLIGIGRAKELSFTGNYIGAEQALAWGLVNRVVPPDELLPTCRQLAADMLSCDPASLRGYKQLIDSGFATTYGEGLRLEARVSRDHARSITPEMVATRRASVQERGRRQSSS
jgi:enoyl-CoA hydratase